MRSIHIVTPSIHVFTPSSCLCTTGYGIHVLFIALHAQVYPEGVPAGSGASKEERQAYVTAHVAALMGAVVGAAPGPNAQVPVWNVYIERPC